MQTPMSRNNYQSNTTNTEQSILNDSFDQEFGVLTFENLTYGPQGSQGPASIQRMVTGDLAVAYIVDGTKTYVGEAAPGTATTDPYWRVFRLDTATGQLKYADGDSNFDNIFDNHASLTY
jgi:hypothetical protein